MNKPDYKLVPEELTKVNRYQTDEEKTLQMQIAYLKGCMHAVLADAKEYMEWASARRIFKKKSTKWRWKVIFMKQFYSHFERRIQEIEWKLDTIKYKP